MSFDSFADSIPEFEAIGKSEAGRGGFTGFLAAFLVTLVLISSCLYYVHGRITVLNLGYQIANSSAELDSLTEEKRRLIMELSMLEKQERIEKEAKERLGMRHSNPHDIIKVRPRN